MSGNRIVTFFIAAVWLVNGLFCKVLNLVPRHQEIVARILGEEYAGFFTKAIGFSEIAMAVWILSGIRTRLNAITQITIIAVMNVIEFIIAPDLLLWGRLNMVFASLFILLIYVNEFHLRSKFAHQS
jgi:hypothetical protein